MSNSKEWKKTKTIYWSDELNDDFDETLSERPPVPENYRYLRRCKVLSWIVYYLIAKPFLSMIVHENPCSNHASRTLLLNFAIALFLQAFYIYIQIYTLCFYYLLRAHRFS